MTTGGDSIQFYGKETVVSMYEKRKAESWSIWHKKQFLFKGVGEEELEEILSALESNEGRSNPMYTLKVYDSITDPKQIKERTEADGSFNFRLYDVEEREASRLGYRSKLELEIVELREKIAAMEAEEEEPEEGAMGVIGKVLGFFNEPEKAEKIINVVRSILSPAQPPHYIGNIYKLGDEESSANFEQVRPTMEQTTQPGKRQYTQEELTRLSGALETIVQNDNKALEHLEKLASIAAKNPVSFQSLLTLLDAY